MCVIFLQAISWLVASGAERCVVVVGASEIEALL